MTFEKNRSIQFLEEKHIPYRLLPTQKDGSLLQMAESADIDTTNLVRAVLLESDLGLMCVVLPEQHVIDFDALKKYTGCQYQPATLSSAQTHFSDCKALVVPPLAFLYDIDVIYDQALVAMSSWITDAGIDQTLVEITNIDQLSFVFQNRCHVLSRPGAALEVEPDEAQTVIRTFAPTDTTTIDALYSLPVRPPLIQALTETGNQTQTRSVELFLHEHPDYAKQLQTFLKQSVFVSDAIQSQTATPDGMIACLGSRLVSVLLRGLVVWNESALPADGPLGKQSLFQHARVAAQVAYKLVTFAGGIKSIDPVTACAITINQHLGYLLLYWLFKPEYFLFNRMMQANNKLSVIDIEKQFLAYGLASDFIKQGHAGAGRLLMDKWQFDELAKQVCQHHHDLTYRGEYEHEVHLVIIVNYLLRHASFGDVANISYPENSIEILGLNPLILAEFSDMMAEYDISLSA